MVCSLVSLSQVWFVLLLSGRLPLRRRIFLSWVPSFWIRLFGLGCRIGCPFSSSIKSCFHRSKATHHHSESPCAIWASDPWPIQSDYQGPHSRTVAIRCCRWWPSRSLLACTYRCSFGRGQCGSPGLTVWSLTRTSVSSCALSQHRYASSHLRSTKLCLYGLASYLQSLTTSVNDLSYLILQPSSTSIPSWNRYSSSLSHSADQ